MTDVCGAIPFTSMQHRLVQAALAARVPIAGTIELTDVCNFRCIHCYVGDRLGTDYFQPGMSKDEIVDLLDQLLDAGCLWLLYSGGDPLARRDFCEIYEETARRGFIVTLFTNGSLIREEHIRLWKRSPPRKIEITLYGRTPETYQKMAGAADACEKVYANIDRLLAHGLPLKLKASVVPETIGEVQAMRQFAESRGVEFVADPLMFGRRNGARIETTGRLRIPVEEVVRSYQEDRALWKRSRDALEKFLDPKSHLDQDFENRLFMCGAGRLTFCVTAKGNLNICSVSVLPEYDLRGGSFMEGWNTVVRKAIEVSRPDHHPCGNCALRPVCASCPASAELEHGDLFGKVQYFCDVSHQVADVLLERPVGSGPIAPSAVSPCEVREARGREPTVSTADGWGRPCAK